MKTEQNKCDYLTEMPLMERVKRHKLTIGDWIGIIVLAFLLGVILG